MHNYPSDITREQFEIIHPDLENAKIITSQCGQSLMKPVGQNFKLVEIERLACGLFQLQNQCLSLLCSRLF